MWTTELWKYSDSSHNSVKSQKPDGKFSGYGKNIWHESIKHSYYFNTFKSGKCGKENIEFKFSEKNVKDGINVSTYIMVLITTTSVKLAQ